MEGIYLEAYKKGERAHLGQECPYGMSLLGRRCAWYAGYWDTIEEKRKEERRKEEFSLF